jgi:hypothetical protein
LCVAVDADDGEVVVSAKFVGLVLFPEKHALAAVTPGLEVVWVIRILDKTHRMIALDDVMPTHDCRSSFSVSFAGDRHGSGAAFDAQLQDESPLDVIQMSHILPFALIISERVHVVIGGSC